MTRQSLLDQVEGLGEELVAAPIQSRGAAEGHGSRGRVVVNCDGGLGNQMFEYAAGLFFGRAFSRSVEVLRPIPAQQQWKGYSRPFQLSEFNISAPVQDAGSVDRMMVSRSKRFKDVRNMLAPLLRAETLEEPQAYAWQPSRIATPSRRSAYVVGYWQAAAYADMMASELREQLVLRKPMASRNQRYAEMIASLACPVSLHVRLGDYTLIRHATGGGKSVSQVLVPEYYEEALASLRKTLGKEHTVVVFSDDPGKTRDMFRGRADCVFIEGNGAEAAHEEMVLMSLCRHHIIANSSFSWWGAWLNGKSDKHVFAPRYWGNTPDSYFPDLYPSGWELVNNL